MVGAVAEMMMAAGLLLICMGLLAGCSVQEEGYGGAKGLLVFSEAFVQGQPVPVRFTCKGEDTSPEVRWEGAPAGTRSVAVILEDPDAPGGVFTHWLVYGIPANQTELAEGIPKEKEVAGGIRQGGNDFGKYGYGGPCPPPGPAHHYVLAVYALDTPVTLGPGAERQALESAMKGHVLASTHITAVFGR